MIVLLLQHRRLTALTNELTLNTEANKRKRTSGKGGSTSEQEMSSKTGTGNKKPKKSSVPAKGKPARISDPFIV